MQKITFERITFKRAAPDPDREISRSSISMQKNTVPHDVCWLASWLAGWLACWLVGWLASGMAGWLAGWLACGLAGWPADWLAGKAVSVYVQRQSFSDTASRDYDTQGDMIFQSFLRLARSS